MELMVRSTPATERIAVLCRAIDALSPAQKENLRHHLRAKTPICCGKLAWKFIDGEAAGLEVLANSKTPRLLKQLTDDGSALVECIEQAWQATFLVLVRSSGGLSSPAYRPVPHLSDYMQAMSHASEDEVRKAIRIVCEHGR